MFQLIFSCSCYPWTILGAVFIWSYVCRSSIFLWRFNEASTDTVKVNCSGTVLLPAPGWSSLDTLKRFLEKKVLLTLSPATRSHNQLDRQWVNKQFDPFDFLRILNQQEWIHSRLEWVLIKSLHQGKRQLGRDRGPLWGSKNQWIKIPYVGTLQQKIQKPLFYYCTVLKTTFC